MNNHHSRKSATLEVHERFVAQVKAAARKLPGKALNLTTILPTIVGAEPLDFKMPPMMEEAFGYRGKLRFVEFSYGGETRQFGYSDGGDRLPSDEALWQTFLNHDLVDIDLGRRLFPTLYGEFERGQRWQCRKSAVGKTPHYCLLFDRQERQPYLCRWDQAVLFFPLTEPENGEDHTVSADGLLLSPGSEDYRIQCPAELRQQFENWLEETWMEEMRLLEAASDFGNLNE